MRKKSLTSLGETEMEVLHHVWDLGEATVADVRERILDERDVAYTTVMTVLKKLAEKGYLDYRKEGRSYVYAAAVPQREVQHTLLRRLMEKVFHGSPSALVQTLIQRESLESDEQDAIRSLLDQLDDLDAERDASDDANDSSDDHA
ncbi:BlaI family transcriptional regulator [Longibacter salinarum]|uniref:BlaI family transcriptional regulator n=1 Tax=Longibacter salinarum TaxID=1850348 RepID=A0A2A8CZ62_9BACT|nr:BlaI/MecI/CopY family transcriptional regulator [Longibacter salinarum]PEN14009.1 BlaI family transcriptional regulator [Longibacter salinarum]